MYICGIIAEYDPFHTGHKLQFDAVRSALGDDCAIICVMSGNWTQRGSAAIVNKFLRARLALMGGADLVLELPLPYAISSAEWFARGGVSVLKAAGIVTHLCFGSESGDLDTLVQTAECLDSDEFSATLKTFLDQGLAFPAARQKAASLLIGEKSDCLSLPNNNLGTEYLRALKWCSSSITPITIQRQGAGHGEIPQGGYASASHLRKILRDGQITDALPYMIECEADLLNNALFSDLKLAERAIIYRLRQLSIENLDAIPDCTEGLSHRLHQAIQSGTNIEEILMYTKSKRYTMARLRRILLWAYLGLTVSDRYEQPEYLRALGMNQTGRSLLRQINCHGTVPVLTKPAHVHNMSQAAQRQFELESRASDFYGLFLPEIPPCGSEWTQSPVII